MHTLLPEAFRVLHEKVQHDVKTAKDHEGYTVLCQLEKGRKLPKGHFLKLPFEIWAEIRHGHGCAGAEKGFLAEVTE